MTYPGNAALPAANGQSRGCSQVFLKSSYYINQDSVRSETFGVDAECIFIEFVLAPRLTTAITHYCTPVGKPRRGYDLGTRTCHHVFGTFWHRTSLNTNRRRNGGRGISFQDFRERRCWQSSKGRLRYPFGTTAKWLTCAIYTGYRSPHLTVHPSRFQTKEAVAQHAPWMAPHAKFLAVYDRPLWRAEHSDRVDWTEQPCPNSSLHQSDLAWSPRLIEERLKRAIEAQDREPALIRVSLNPVAARNALRLLRPKPDRGRAVGSGLGSR